MLLPGGRAVKRNQRVMQGFRGLGVLGLPKWNVTPVGLEIDTPIDLLIASFLKRILSAFAPARGLAKVLVCRGPELVALQEIERRKREKGDDVDREMADRALANKDFCCSSGMAWNHAPAEELVKKLAKPETDITPLEFKRPR